VRYAMRVLRRVPAFSVTACVILTAGIGLNLSDRRHGAGRCVGRLRSRRSCGRGVSRVTRDVRGSGSSATAGVVFAETRRYSSQWLQKGHL
jgi:hypothetical protein